MLNKNQQELYKRIEQEIVGYLELQPYWERSKTIPNKGGLDYRWFWLAARYIQDHQGIDVYDGAGNLKEVFEGVFTLVRERAGTELAQTIQQLGRAVRTVG